ncbi:MAG TPA: ROK family protein [Verrucomicrobiae bacterium]|nr:ROK family protein [Verrucomicrobiae bacterium]
MRIGVDLGGTKIEAVVLDGAGEPLVRRRVPTPAGDYDGTLRAIAGLVEAVERETGPCAQTVGIGTPGIPSRVTGAMKNANSTVLIGKPLEGDLRAMLGRPVRLANDADCFTLSESRGGAADGAGIVFGVILGTGVGGGIVVGGRTLQGPNGIAGEWGHNPLPWPQDDERPGPACYCGKRGCIETFLCGPRLREADRRATGRGREPAAIAADAAGGDAEAERLMARYEDRLARGLATVVNLLDPDVVVLGGGLSNLERLYANVPPLLGRYVFSDRVETRLARARFGDSSGVRGAALLVDKAPPTAAPY